MLLQRIALVTALAFVALAATAQAAPTWLAPTQLSEPRQFTEELGGNGPPNAAMSASGEAIVVWTRRDAANTFRLYANVRAPGGAWSQPQQIGVTRSYGFQAPLDAPPALAVDARGNAIVAFEHPVGDETVIQAALRPAGGSFGQPVPLSEPGQPARAPVVAMNASGAAVAAWTRSDGTHWIAQAAMRPPGGRFGTVEDLSALGQNALEPAVDINAAGTIVAAWLRSDGAGLLAQATVRPPSGAFAEPQDLAGAGTTATGMDVALDPAGRATVVWTRTTTSAWAALTMWRDTTGPFTGLQEISPPGQFSAFPGVVVDHENTATAVWTTSTPEGQRLLSASRPNGASFGAPQPISTTETAPGLRPTSMSVDPTGAVLAAWIRVESNPTVTTIQAARRPAGGEFGGVATISARAAGSAFAPRIATDAAGNGVVAYQSLAGTDPIVSTIGAAGFDLAPPDLSQLSVPATGAIGAPLAFSGSARDVWSPVSVRWSFGDGQGASGSSVSHAYASPGAYTVTVTATDAVGHSVSASRQVVISAPPAPPAPPAAPPVVLPAAPPAIGIDRDGDGFLAGQDCNDADPAIRPGAAELPGNRIDENCDGVAEPFPTLESGVLTRWHVRGSRVRLTALRITQRFPRGWRARITCSGRRCPFKTRKLKPRKVRKGASNVIRSLRPRHRRFRAGQRLEVWVSAPGYNTKVARYRLRRGRIPTAQPLCAAPGATRPQRRCD